MGNKGKGDENNYSTAAVKKSSRRKDPKFGYDL
jgi:hypothetical protein